MKDTYCASIDADTVGYSLYPHNNLIWDDITGGLNAISNISTGTSPTDSQIWICPTDNNYIVSVQYIGTFTDSYYNNGPNNCGGTPISYNRGIVDGIIGLFLDVLTADRIFSRLELGSFTVPTSFTAPTEGPFTFNISSSNTIFIPANAKVWIRWALTYNQVISEPFSIGWVFNFQAKNLYIKNITTFPASTGQVFLINESLSRVAESVTQSQLKVYSDFFGRTDALPYPSVADGCGGLACISNGRFIRQALLANDGTLATMSISFTDLMSDLNAIWRIGMGLEPDPNRAGYQLLRVESEDYFYNDTILFTLDNVNTLETSHNGALDISVVNLGYPNWQCWTINGLDEYNTQRRYRTSLKSTQNTKDITCKMVTSGYAIEFTRRQGGGSSDWRYDSNNFLICLRRVGIDEFPPPFPNIGIDSTAVNPATAVNLFPENVSPSYNARISPARTALRHIPAIFRSYQDFYNGQLIYTWGDGNYLAKFEGDNGITWPCEKTTQVLGENQLLDYTVFDHPLDNYPLFRNEIVKFDYPLTVEQFLILKANPYGLIGYSVNNGPTLYGWIENMTFTPQADGSSHGFMASFELRPKIIFV